MRRLVIGLCIVWLGIGGAVAQGPPPLPEPIPLETFGTAWDMAWRPQHDTLAVATRDTVWLLDEQLQVLDKLPTDVIAFDIEWSPDGKWLMVRHEQALEIWNVDNHAHVLNIPHYPASEEVLQTITWSPDSHWLAVAQSRDDPAASYLRQIRSIEIWDIAAAQTAYEWVVDYLPVGLVWHPHDGQQLAVVHGQVDIVDPTTWTTQQTLLGGVVSYPVTWSPDGTMLAAQSGDTVLVWDVREAQPCQRLPTYHRYLPELTWGAGGLMVVDGSGKGVVWNTNTWTIQDVYSVYTRMAWHPNGQRLVAAGTILELWDTTHHRRLASNWRYTSPPRALVWYPSGEALLTVTSAIDATVWDTNDGSFHRRLPFRAIMAAFSPDGRLLVTIDADYATLHVWDVAAGVSLHTIRPSDDVRYASDVLFWSPDAQQVVTSDANASTVWDATTWLRLISIEGNFGGWSPDGSRFVMVDNGHGAVHDAQSGAVILDMDTSRVAHDDKLHLQWLASGALMGNDEQMRYQWDATTGVLLDHRPLPLQAYLFESFVWNEQGTAYVMRVGYDAWAVVDAASDTIIGQRSMCGWPMSQKPVWSPDGTRLAYIHDERVWLWTIGGDGEQGHTAQ